MKPNNVMLLGFVNKAIEYLDKHMDEEPNTRLSQLKNIDLASIKEELNNHLDASLGTMQSTMSTLLKAGNEAFDEFLIGTYGEASVPEQLDKIFDVNLDDEESAVSKQDELAKLLSFYNLDFDTEHKEFHEDDLSVNDDEFMKEIVKNASNDIEPAKEQPLVKDSKNAEEIDSIFNEIVEHENVKQVPSKEDKEKEEVKALIKDLREKLVIEQESRKRAEAELIRQRKIAEAKRIAEQKAIEAKRIAEERRIAEEKRIAEQKAAEAKRIAEQKAKAEEENVNVEQTYRPFFSSLMERLKDQMIKQEENEKKQKLAEEKKKAEEERIEQEKRAAQAKQAAIKAAEQAKLEAARKAEEERKAEAARKAEEERKAKEEAEANKPYVSSLIEELKAKLAKEENDLKEKEIKNKDVYEEISKKYENLPMNFIRSVYDLKESLSYDYKDGQNLIVLHRINFKDVEDLRRFVEISMGHNYNVNADENKLIVDTFKEINNGDGKIIANIFEVANQAFLINGEYEGYNVINNDIE